MSRSVDMVRGTAVGTGAIMAIACGFIPRHVELWNLVTGAKGEWDQMMALAYAPGFPQGIKDIGTSSFTRAVMTAGILPYPGGDKIQYLTGNLYWTIYALANSALLGAPSIAANANQIFLDGDWEMPGFSVTSVTSNTIASSGSLTFTITIPAGAPPLTWLTPGSSVLIYGTTITNFIVATVVSLTGNTLVVTATADGGSGTLTSWTIIPQAATGIQGINYNCAGFAVDPGGQNPYNGVIVEVPAGFIIGAEASLNISTDQMLWIAYR